MKIDFKELLPKFSATCSAYFRFRPESPTLAILTRTVSLFPTATSSLKNAAQIELYTQKTG